VVDTWRGGYVTALGTEHKLTLTILSDGTFKVSNDAVRLSVVNCTGTWSWREGTQYGFSSWRSCTKTRDPENKHWEEGAETIDYDYEHESATRQGTLAGDTLHLISDNLYSDPNPYLFNRFLSYFLIYIITSESREQSKLK